MKVEPIDRAPSPWVQCEAEPQVTTEHIRKWREQAYDVNPKKCRRRARYLVMGRVYCAVHAGLLLLADALAKNEAE